MLIVLPDVVDGLLVNAVWGLAGMLAKTRYSRRTSSALDLASWADTDALIRNGLPGARLELPEMSDPEAAELEVVLKRHEVQGALQALLAARLTDAPESDAATAREAVRLAITGAAAASTVIGDMRPAQPTGGGEPPAGSVAELCAGQLTEYFDERISALVAELEGRVGLDGLAQVRAEAYSGRIVALLGAIERQVAALSAPERGSRAEVQWLGRYRRQARARHGYLYPPDFDRRRKVRAETIYVNTRVVSHLRTQVRLGGQTISERPAGEMDFDPADLPSEASLTVMDLARRLDRTVLLGDPGGGKTTSANVLADFFASDPARKIPFFVTLREYATKIPPQWSVTGYIEQTLSTLYQCGPPDGLVERLLLTGQAVVIFDGLDELLDTSRRREVSERVEQFCSAFPLTQVLVTSRVVGYDQARLDDTQFNCFRLSGFGDDEVAEYVGKWFATQDGIARAAATAKTEAFLSESANATDLRTNPLLLSLMCILYRGGGSLPGDRAGIYARCAELMLRKWDEQRDLYRKLGSDHLVDPTLRYLAWWLFTRKDSQTAATEGELISKTTEFLHGRGYETEEEARAAAREFIAFCRGRMWVFSDAGTTADGEELYGFTHRTFMEYFAAWHLAATSDTPEDLARVLAPHISSEGWSVVGELAIKIKSEMSDRGADRIYAALLDPALAPGDRGPLVGFLAEQLPSARPAPTTVRDLTRYALDYAVRPGKPVYQGLIPLWSLLIHGSGRYQLSMAEEMSSWLAAKVASERGATRNDGLRLALRVPNLIIGREPLFKIPPPTNEILDFWKGWSQGQCHRHSAELTAGAVTDEDLRTLAVYAGEVKLEDALAMPGGLDALFTVAPIIVTDGENHTYTRSLFPYAVSFSRRLLRAHDSHPPDMGELTSIGQYVTGRTPPWIRDPFREGSAIAYNHVTGYEHLLTLDEVANLGTAVLLCATLEFDSALRRKVENLSSSSENGRVELLFRYLMYRLNGHHRLPDLPVPVEFRQLFRDWAEKRVDFVATWTEQSSGLA